MPVVAPFPSTRLYRDLDMNFQPHPATGDVRTREGIDAIKRAVKSLVLTSFYDYPYEPRIGSRVPKLLFENIDLSLEIDLKESIYEVLSNYEPDRVEIIEIITDFQNDRNGVNIVITFNALNIGVDSVNFFLQRVR